MLITKINTNENKMIQIDTNKTHSILIPRSLYSIIGYIIGIRLTKFIRSGNH
jgi:hypothetical protein